MKNLHLFSRAFLLAFTVLLIADQQIKAKNTSSDLIEIRFSQHRFIPVKVQIKAGQPFTIRVVNSSQERIEFESFKLDREKVVEPGQTIVIRVPALRAGSYDFYDDFHNDVPEGVIEAR